MMILLVYLAVLLAACYLQTAISWSLLSPQCPSRIARKPRNRPALVVLYDSATGNSAGAAEQAYLDAEDPLDAPDVYYYDPDLLCMGISQELDELPVVESLHKKVYNMKLDMTNKTIEIQKLSQRPPIFHLKGILDPETDVDYIRSLTRTSTAKEDSSSFSQFEVAQRRIGGNESSQYRKNSQVAWISNVEYPELGWLKKSVQEIFLPFEPPILPPFQDWFSMQALEDMQVVKYKTQGEYHLHHDGALRLLTVIYYLNGVSETWFPLADNNGIRMRNRKEALREAARPAFKVTFKRGVLASSSSKTAAEKNDRAAVVANIQPGDAIAFYNYFQDGSAEWNAIHAGLPASSTKWIATHWHHHVPQPASFKDGNQAELHFHVSHTLMGHERKALS